MPVTVAIDAHDVQNLVNGDVNGDQVGRDKFGGDHVLGNKVQSPRRLFVENIPPLPPGLMPWIGNQVIIQICNTAVDSATIEQLGLIESDGTISQNFRRICDLVSRMILADLQSNPQQPTMSGLRETKIALEEFQTLRYTGVLDTRLNRREIRFDDIISLIPASPLPDPNITLRFYASMRNLRQRKGILKSQSLPVSSKILRWLENSSSGLICLKGNYSRRQLLRDVAADVITMLIEQKVHLVWLLQPNGGDFQEFDKIEATKQLVFQVMQLNHTSMDERSASLTRAMIREARTAHDWFGLLGRALLGIEQIFIVIDLEALGVQRQEFRWAHEFSGLLQDLQSRGVTTVTKIILLSHREYSTEGVRHDCDFVFDISSIPTLSSDILEKCTDDH
ncbi:hypothetical protein BDQ94DRAFT_173452 [Aspergillus welwitschiae]|uniref:Uncharacterized protein n=1 Tax=Aspergillus welwitschiae TaxID=1341132 RepID=A0A3F3PSS4_9EURO|nr:hypothetical protein BDQ94DRAFT_173452 [Aspergillus welwitschiae]RDH29964.1 hypothetical protein BDQ94DRAFT_173452 [Aspergillus welwitschiae]